MALPDPQPTPTPQPTNQTILDAYGNFQDWIDLISAQNLNQTMKYSDALILVRGIQAILHAEEQS